MTRCHLLPRPDHNVSASIDTEEFGRVEVWATAYYTRDKGRVVLIETEDVEAQDEKGNLVELSREDLDRAYDALAEAHHA